uniref:INCENP_ARK-bind domain-containing protein n=1 Tax=Meloidogyne hapla TaxID=6305 RepID=A0A1I8BGN1_MELHA
MSEEENHKYSLLLLRLQRARDFFQNRKGVKMLNSGSSDNKEEIIEEINKISIKNSTKNDEENKKEDLERIMQLRDDKGKKEERNSRFLVDGAVIGKIQQKFNNKINEGNRTEKQNNGSLFYSKTKILNNDNVNTNILLRKIHRLRNLNNRKTTSTPRLVPFPVKKRQQNGQRVVPVRMQINNRQRGIRKRIKIPLKYTNSTKEIIPPIQNNLNWADIDEFFTDSITSSTTDNSPFNQQKSKQTNLKEELNWQRRGPNRRELGIKKLRKSGDNAGNLLEEEINEQFLENKEKEHNGMLNIASSSGGGSFAQETFENTGTHQNGVSLLQMPFTQKENIDTSPLVRAPKFNVVPLINNPQIKKSGPRRDGWVHIEGVSEIVDNSRLNGLLECCQEQSFGCRQIF